MKDILKSSVLHNEYDLSSRSCSTQFYKEHFSSKDVPRFPSVTILLINGLKNIHPLKFINQQCSFYSSYDHLCVFCIFKFQYSIHKKSMPIATSAPNSSFLSYYIQGNNCRKSTRKQQVTTAYRRGYFTMSCLSKFKWVTLLTSLPYLVYCVPQSIAHWIHFIHESSFYSY